jgi:hypothetical protein
MPEITIPHTENAVQRQIRALVDLHRFSVLVIHRQAGKTTQGVVEAIYAALSSPNPSPRAAYVSEFLNMSRRNAWDYTKRLAGVVPDVKFNETQLTADFPHNGGRVSLFGSDNPDALRGLHHDFAVLDEYALMDPRTWPEVVLPTLLARNGKALLMGTVLSRHDPLWSMYTRAATLDGWGRLLIRASESGILNAKQLADARAVMSPEQYAREMECEPSAAIDGSIYGKQLDAMEKEGRLGHVPWNPAVPVWTAWDIGVSDSTAIWFLQPDGKSWTAIDYEEHAGVGMSFYVKLLKEKPYLYREHIGPHDLAVQEFGSGKTRLEVARELGIDFLLAPRLPVEEGVEAVRNFLPRLWMDRSKCARALEGLQDYRYTWDETLRIFSRRPFHSWSSHACDALRMFATTNTTPLDLRTLGDPFVTCNWRAGQPFPGQGRR